MDLYNRNGIKSVWEIIKDYDGAFFRAEGGLADDFKESQDEPTKTYLYVLNEPWVFLSTLSITYLQTLTPDNQYTSTYTYTIRDLHIIKIDVGEINSTLYFESGRSETVANSTIIYNYTCNIGTLQNLLDNQWTRQDVDEFTVVLGNDDTNIASISSNATPTTAQKINRIKPFGLPSLTNGTVYFEENNPTTYNVRSQLLYNKNVSLGHLEGQFQKWNVVEKELDRPHAYPKEGIILTTSNTATPNESQTIKFVYKLADQDNFVVEFVDGTSSTISGSTVYYYVGINDTLAVPTVVAYNCGQIRTIFDVWTETSAEYDYIKLDNNEEHCWVYSNITSATPTDVQIISKIFNEPYSNNNSTLYQFLDNHSTWYDYNNNSVYFKDLTTNTNIFIGYATAFNDKFIWDYETKLETIYLPNDSENLVLSIASSATPTTAQEIRSIRFDISKDAEFLVEAQQNWYETRLQNDTVTVTNALNTTLYNKNTVYGSVNVLKLEWIEDEYLVEIEQELSDDDIETDVEQEPIYKKYWKPVQNLYFKQDDVLYQLIDIRESSTVDGQYVYRIYHEDEITETVIANNATAVQFYDDNNELYSITVQSCMYPAIKTQQEITYYYAPKTGNPLSASVTTGYSYKIWNSNNTNLNITSLTPNHTYIDDTTNYHNVIIFKVWNVPGTTNGGIICSFNGTCSVVNNTGDNLYAANVVRRSIKGLELCRLYSKQIQDTVILFNPPEISGFDGNKFIASIASQATVTEANQIESIRYKQYSNYFVVKFINGINGLYANNVSIYDRNISARYTAGIPINSDIKTHDIEYYYPPEFDYKGDVYTPTIASAVTPTDAQRITRIDPIEGQTTFNVFFADGHSAVYANTTAVYNQNLYYTTLEGIRFAQNNEYIMTPTWYNFPPENTIINSASNLEPTDAQRILKIRYIEDTTNIIRYFKDGHTDLVAYNTKTYNLNVEIATLSSGCKLNLTDKSVYWQEEMLPNLKGQFGYDTIEYGNNWAVRVGVFANDIGTGLYNLSGGGAGNENRIAVFNANLNKKTYKDGISKELANENISISTSEVRPNNYTIRIWKRIK